MTTVIEQSPAVAMDPAVAPTGTPAGSLRLHWRRLGTRLRDRLRLPTGHPGYVWAFTLFVVSDVFSGHTKGMGLPVGPDRILFVLAIVLVVLDPRSGLRDLTVRPVHVFAFVTVSIAVISGLFYNTLSTSLGAFALLDRLVIPYVSFGLAPIVYRRRTDQILLLKALVLLGIYLGGTAFAEVIGPRAAVFPRYITNPAIGIQFGRARGPFVEAEADGLTMIGCGFSAVILTRLVAGRWRLVARVAMVATVVGCLLTLTRSIWIGTVLGLILLAFVDRKLRRGVVITVVLVALGVCGALLGSHPLREKVNSRAGDSRSVYDRQNTDAAAIRAIEAHPLTGIGWLKFIDESSQYVRQNPNYPVTTTDIEVHNVVLSRFAELGIPGGLIWLISVLLGPLYAVVRRPTRPDQRLLRIAAAGVFFSWSVSVMLSPVPYPLPNVLVWMFAGLALSDYLLGNESRFPRVAHSPNSPVIMSSRAENAVLPARKLMITPSSSLLRSSARGFAYSGAQVMLNRVLSLVSFAILARLLSPHDYGIAALAGVFALLFSTLSAGGYGQALAQRKEIDQDYCDTTFWIASTTGVLLAALMCALAKPVALWFGEPQLFPVLLVLSVSFVVIGISSTPNALLQRGLRFDKIAHANVAGNVIATAVGIGFAFAGFGVWSLVIQTVLAPALAAIGLWRAASFRPRRHVAREQVRPILSVSRHFLGFSLMDFFSQRTDDFLVGAQLGSVVLGIYSVAYRLISVLMDVLANSVKLVALPAFAKLQGDRERMASSYEAALRLSASVVMPCFLFIVAAAPELVRAVFGDKWAACIPVVRVLSLYGALEAVMIVNAVFLQAVGRARLAFRLSAAGTVLQVIAFFAAVHFGLTWVAAAYVLRSYVIAPFGLRAAAKTIEQPLTRTVAMIAAPALCSGAMAVVVWLAGRHVAPGSSLEALAILIPLGGAVYLGLLATTARRHAAEIWRLGGDLKRRMA